MSDLRDQLLKAGLVTAKQATDADKQARRQRKKQGAKATRRQQEQRRRRLQEERAQSAAADRERSVASRSGEEDKQLALRVSQIIESNGLDLKIQGRRRWYFVNRSGRVPYLELGDEAAARLESGAAAITESPTGAVRLVTAAGARRVCELDDRWLVQWRR